MNQGKEKCEGIPVQARVQDVDYIRNCYGAFSNVCGEDNLQVAQLQMCGGLK